VDEHPIVLKVDEDLRRSRLTVFFRLLLAIPLVIWLILWTIAAFVAAIVGWIAALFTARLPQGIHGFLARYVRFSAHVGAYIGLAANPYPPFNGEPGYDVDVRIPSQPERQPRWSIAIRLLLAAPALFLAAILGSGTGSGGWGGTRDREAEWFANSGVGGVAAICAFLGWFAVLATGRMPLGLRNLGAYGIGYAAQASAYVLLLTDRYPNSDPDAIGPAWALPEHPVALVLDDDRRRSRVTVFFRLLLAIPHLVWLSLWGVLAFLAAIANGVVALVRGRSADPLHRFLAAYIRYEAHVKAFVFLVANPFPGFTGDPAYPVGVAVAGPERQNRWKTFFRIFLAVPALFVSGGLFVALFAVGVLGWFAALATARMPTGLRNLGAVAIRYQAQTNAYLLVLTDRYPHASPALRPPPEPEPEPAAEAAA
jgi:hypothetical protein